MSACESCSPERDALGAPCFCSAAECSHEYARWRKGQIFGHRTPLQLIEGSQVVKTREEWNHRGLALGFLDLGCALRGAHAFCI